MSCGCTTYECIDVFKDACASTISTTLIADETGTWKMIFDFNGVVIRTDISVINGEFISLPADVFNENYLHVVTFYKRDNSIFNDTCYKINIMATVFSNPGSSSSVVYETTQLVFALGDNAPALTIDTISVSDGATITSSLLVGISVLRVSIGNITEEPLTADGWSHNSTTGVLSLGNSYSDINVYVLIKKTVTN